MISVLVATFNRRVLLERALNSVLGQTYRDFEIVLIDDASTDYTSCMPHYDQRIRYYRNEENQGGKHGDRVHITRFVHELARGDYFVYLCDDDYLIPAGLLAMQMAHMTPGTAMVIGGQMSHYPGEKWCEYFHKGIHPKERMTSDEFLESFASDPMGCNINTGATLYNKEMFIKSGALSNSNGSKWQCGYEMKLAPGSYGDVIYMDQPCLMVQQEASSASYTHTQVGHYLDSVKSLIDAFRNPMRDFPGRNLDQIAMKAFDKLSEGYLGNAKHIAEHGSISLCSKENIRYPVTQAEVESQQAIFISAINNEV